MAQAVPAAPAPVAAPEQPPKAQPQVDLQGEYSAKINAYLNSIKRYPTGREVSLTRPQGVVKVWYVLSRDGKVLDSGIDDSSNSMILDNAALATIRRGDGNFPPFPEKAWEGAPTHRFVTELNFKPAN